MYSMISLRHMFNGLCNILMNYLKCLLALLVSITHPIYICNQKNNIPPCVVLHFASLLGYS
ncbi:hypothetical protein BZ21_258 [Yersinia pseudotuberculosis]|nr:hypothetical protein DJ40_1344 [Yersinia pseudotuberculosis]AJJ67852.1 hypothetical protein BZ16_375 [Yersinia pseudotuberculosis PB1/+]CQD51021.1 Uncharacterised protein [Yersinia intermedia]AJJ04846.1 hypothetical protein BZ21_258 [Yersinia pseudotuberculosis]AJJ05439.1 hypothetical protein BZ20_1031 [Yersinia pseudotuberculosis]